MPLIFRCSTFTQLFNKNVQINFAVQMNADTAHNGTITRQQCNVAIWLKT